MTDKRANHQADSDLYRRLVESVRDYAIISLDASGRVVTWNPGARRLQQYAADDVIGRQFSSLFSSRDTGLNSPEHLLDVAAREGRVEGERWMLRKDGSSFCAVLAVTALRN